MDERRTNPATSPSAHRITVRFIEGLEGEQLGDFYEAQYGDPTVVEQPISSIDKDRETAVSTVKLALAMRGIPPNAPVVDLPPITRMQRA